MKIVKKSCLNLQIVANLSHPSEILALRSCKQSQRGNMNTRYDNMHFTLHYCSFLCKRVCECKVAFLKLGLVSRNFAAAKNKKTVELAVILLLQQKRSS